MNDASKRPLLAALAELRDVPAAVGDAEDEARRRTRIASHIVATNLTHANGVRRRRASVLWLAAALSMGGWLLFWLGPKPPASTSLHASVARPAAGTLSSLAKGLSEPRAPVPDTWQLSAALTQPALQVLSGQVSVTPPSGAGTTPTWTAAETSRLRLDDDVEVELAPQTQVRVSSNGGTRRELEVLQGRVSVLSAPRPARVVVRTESVRIDSIGATFSVSFLSKGTHVSVDSGAVRLDRPGWSQELRSGEQWNHEDGSPPNTSGIGGAPPRDESSDQEPTEQTLTEQNRMFQTALLAKRRGLDSLALRRLDELLAAYPNGAHSENARVERFRILQRSGANEARAAEARAAASKYLSLHPNGFARAEAERLLQSER